MLRFTVLLVVAFAASSSWGDDIQAEVEEFIFESAPFPQCHASTIAEATDGTLVAAWFGGTREKAPDVGIWVSRRGQDGWSSPVEVADGVQYAKLDGTVHRHPCWNPVLFQPNNGPLLLFYKVGPDPQSWWGMLMTSDDHGATWNPPRRLPEHIDGPVKNKPIELSDGTILCGSSTEFDGWRVHFESTRDFGLTWTRTAPIHDGKAIEAIQPSLLRLADDRLLAIGRSRQNKVFVVESHDSGKSWGEMKLGDLPNPNSGTDALTLADGRHLIVYNHVPGEPGKWGGKRSPLNVAIADPALEQWQPLSVLESEPKAEFSYPAMIQTRDGKIHITYTWKRQRVKHVVLNVPPQ